MQRVLVFIIILAISLTACAPQIESTILPSVGPTEVISNDDLTPTSETSANESTDPATEISQDSQAIAENSSSTVRFVIIPQESLVQYEVGETFINQGNVFNIAIGVTKGISGALTIDFTNPQNSSIETITIDISQFTSDSNRRDNAIRDRFLESSRYPLATFTTKNIEGLPVDGQEGIDYSLKITGDLTVKDITKSVTFEAIVQFAGDKLSGSATTTILLSDFGVGPISIAGILETQDEAKLTFTFTAQSEE